jgi:hypothetical protein
VEQLNQERRLQILPPRPLESELPFILVGKLRISSSLLMWSAALSEEDFNALRVALEPLEPEPPHPIWTPIVRELLLRVNQGRQYRRRIEEPVPDLLFALVEQFSGRLHIENGFLIWTALPPTTDELDALNSLEGDLDFTGSLARLVERIQDIEQLKANENASLEGVMPVEQRPGLPEPLEGLLTIESKRLTLSHRVVSQEQKTALEGLRGRGDPPFREGIEALLSIFERVEFIDQVRPEIDDLPAELVERLVLGRAAMRFPGVMSAHTAQVLRNDQEAPGAPVFFQRLVDRDAVQRLYKATLAHGMGGRAIQIRARRGSASISAPAEITIRS